MIFASSLTYVQAIVIGALQGVTELFPISSLGHSVLIPAWLGWDGLLQGESAKESFYLAFLVGLHVATALALVVFFRKDWSRIIRGFFTSIRHRRAETADERMAWMLILATIPVGIFGLVFEHSLRVVFAKPIAASIFLTLNGGILLAGERLRRRSQANPDRVRTVSAKPVGADVQPSSRPLDSLGYRDGVIVGSSQIGALFAGVSRSGIAMVAGLLRGLDHEDAARFSFLLATPVILAAGVYKIPDLLGPNGDGIRGQALVGSAVAAVCAFLAVRFLTRFFRTRTLTPFAIYCLVFGILSFVRFV